MFFVPIRSVPQDVQGTVCLECLRRPSISPCQAWKAFLPVSAALLVSPPSHFLLRAPLIPQLHAPTPTFALGCEPFPLRARAHTHGAEVQGGWGAEAGRGVLLQSRMGCSSWSPGPWPPSGTAVLSQQPAGPFPWTSSSPAPQPPSPPANTRTLECTSSAPAPSNLLTPSGSFSATQ